MQYDFINKKLEELRKKWKLSVMLDFTKLSSYIKTDCKGVDRIHCSWDCFATVTGRIHSYNPNIQGLPKKIRESCFKAQAGYELIYADYKSEELVIIAILANDTALLNDIYLGIDLHAKVASKLFNKSLKSITEEERVIAKKVTFATIYGAGEQVLINTMKSANVEWTNGLNIKKTILGFYPAVDFLRRKIISDNEIRMIDGSIVELSSIKKDYSYVNRLVQGTGAIILKEVLNQLDDRLPKDCSVVCLIHDEIIIEAMESDKGKVINILHDVMENALSTFGIYEKMAVDIKEEKKYEQK